MNYKRRSRRRDKRVMARCGCCAIYNNDPYKVPIEDAPCMGRAVSKSKTPRKAKCPQGGSHEWVHEQRQERNSEITHRAGYWACADCKSAQREAAEAYTAKWKSIARMGEKVPWYIYQSVRCADHDIERFYTINVKVSLCLKCGKEIEKAGRRVYDDGHGDYYHGVRRYIPSREVQV